MTGEDCKRLGDEYLHDAQVLLDRVKILKAQEDYKKNKYLVDNLYQMGLECRKTGKKLLERLEPLTVLSKLKNEKIQWYEMELSPLIIFRLLKRHSEDQAEFDWKMRKLIRVMKYAIDQELTEKQKECILLRYMNDKNNKEIAEILNIAESVASRHLSRGLKNLQHVLKYACFFEKEEVDDEDEFKP